MTVTATAPVVVERAMWWTKDAAEWYETSLSVGVTEPGMVWVVPESSTAGSTNQQTSKTFSVAAETRLTVNVAAEFPASDGRTFDIIVESLGAGAPIVVECTRYATPGGSRLDEGESAPATRIR